MKQYIVLQVMVKQTSSTVTEIFIAMVMAMGVRVALTMKDMGIFLKIIVTMQRKPAKGHL